MTDKHDTRAGENTASRNSDTEEIAKLYRSMSTEQSSPHIDETILAMARKAAEQRQTTRKHWVKRWSTPVSIAAVLVLSVSIVSVIKQESLRAPDFSSIDSIPLDETSSSTTAATQKKDIHTEDVPARDKVTRKRMIENDLNNTDRPTKAKSTVGAVSKSEGEQKSATRVMPMMESAVIENTTILEKESGARVEKQNSTANVASAPPQDITATINNPTAKARAKKSAQIADDNLAGILSKPIPAEEHDVAAATQLHQSKPTAAFMHAPSLAPADINVLCANSSETKCLTSMQCTLVTTKSGLQCRTAANHCETNFSQREDAAEHCQQRMNCDYRAGKCQCDDAEKCQCGETGPALCEPIHE